MDRQTLDNRSLHKLSLSIQFIIWANKPLGYKHILFPLEYIEKVNLVLQKLGHCDLI